MTRQRLVILRSHSDRSARKTWRAAWPVMVGGVYHVGLGGRWLNGGYVRLGQHLFGICIMPRRRSIKEET
jgi:hypothetical protein